MSGLAAMEPRLMPGAVNVFIGEGRTAEVLRNLCFQVTEGEAGTERWDAIVAQIKDLFGVELDRPKLIEGRGEIEMSFRNMSKTRLDLSACGRGLQQTLLLMAYLMTNPRSVLLLDEPDAHLEILRQRQIYRLLTEVASENGSQIVAASHSEVILNEAADRDVVVAFVGSKPHRIDDRGAQVLKSLRSLGFEHYYQAEITGWVLYLEGSTDLAILRTLARVLGHKAQDPFDRPFVEYVGNQPPRMEGHFYGIREAKPDLVGFALFDRLDRAPDDTHAQLDVHCWRKCEIENYIVQRESLLSWARETGAKRDDEGGGGGPLFGDRWEQAMDASITEIEEAMRTLGESPWSDDVKVTDRFLDPLFDRFFKDLGLPQLFRKSDYHELARYVTPESLDGEVTEILDAICAVASKAVPRQ